MLGIRDYEPNFFREADTFNKVLGDTLLKLIGKPVDDYWLMWETKENEWYNDGPVILKIDNRQFEFTAHQLDEFSLTVNQIDLNQKLDWYGAGDEIPLIWKSKCHSAIDQIIGLSIKEISILTFKLITTIIEDKLNRKNVGMQHESDYMLHGIQFDFDDHGQTRYLQIFNGLDQNGLSSEPSKEDYQNKRIKITGSG